jgi:hypothetical protein
MAGGRDIRAGGAFVELFAKDERLRDTLRRAQRRVQAWGQRVSAIGAGIAAGGAALAAPLAASTVIFARYGDQLNKAAIRTGFSVEALSRLGFAAEQTGASFDAMAGAVLRANRRIGRIAGGLGSGQQLAAVEALGLSADALARMTPEQRLYAVADAMAAFEDQTVAAGLAQRIFGTQVDAILPLLLGGAGGMRALTDEAERLGLTVSAASAQLAADLTDAQNRARRVFLDLAFTVGESLAPAVIRAADAVTEAVRVSAAWVDQNRHVVVAVSSVAAALVGVGGALLGVGVGIQVAGFALGGLATIAGVAGTALAFLASPVGLVAVGVAGLVAALVKLTPVGAMVAASMASVAGAVSEVGGGVRTTVAAIVAALSAGNIELAGQVAANGLRLAWVTALAGLQTAWSDTMLAVEVTALHVAEAIGDAFRAAANVAIDAMIGLVRALDNPLIRQLIKELTGLSGTAVATIAAGAISQLEGQKATNQARTARPTDVRSAFEGVDGVTDEAQGAVDAARRALDLSIAQAEREAATKDEERRRAVDQAAAGGEDAAKRTAVAGTFGGALAARILGGASAAGERTAVATERTAAGVEQMQRDMARTAPVFG